MNEQAKEERDERVSSFLIGTGLASVKHLWRQRFDRKLQDSRELLDYLCAEHGKQLYEAKKMTLDEVPTC
jgi:TolB-like protein